MDYDIIVVGAGPGGYVAAVRAAQRGMKTLCVDSRPSGGGTCLHVGCIPSKTLLQISEQYAFLQKQGKECGILTQGLEVDWNAMQKRKGEVVSALASGVGSLFEQYKVDFKVGKALLATAHSIELEQEGKRSTFSAPVILLATGSEPISLPFLPFDEKVVLSSTGALSLPKIPKSLLVIGGGVIGVELASVYARLGAAVTIVEMLPQICVGLDSGLSRALEKALSKQGITFRLEARVTEAQIEKKGVTLKIERAGNIEELQGQHVLVAIGRRSYSKGLELERVGLKVDAKGFLPVNNRYQTNVPSIYAIGDLIQGPMLAHRASEEGYALIEALNGNAISVEEWLIPNVIYTHPEVATVGFTEQEARAQGLEVVVGQSSMRANARARCTGELEGSVKVIAHAPSGRVIGLHVMASHASEMIGEGVIALKKGATLSDIAYAPHAHPTLSEAIKEACLAALELSIK